MNSLIGTIGAVVNGTVFTVSNAVNSAINTLGTNIQVSGDGLVMLCVLSMSYRCVHVFT